MAEDATSDVFMKALKAIPRYRPEVGSFHSWLFVIAHNVVVDEHRRKRPFSLHVVAMESSTLPGPEQRTLASDRTRTLSSLLAQLPQLQANVVELRLAGLDDGEIARVLGRSPGAIRGTQHRAVKRLRELFAEADGLDEGLRYVNE